MADFGGQIPRLSEALGSSAKRAVEEQAAHESGTPEKPTYRKQLVQIARTARATDMYMIVVDEGWRSWILCTDMYEWAADHLLAVLRASGTKWPR